MFERFGEGSRQVVVLAQEEARLLGHDYIGTEHLLLGLIHVGKGIGAEALAALGLTLEGTRQDVEEIIGRRAGDLPVGHIPFTPRAKRVLELALREALQLGHREIGSGHILLGLEREPEGVAAQIIVRRGVALAQVREAVLERFAERPPARASATPRPQPPVGPHVAGPPSTTPRCQYCRSDLAGNLRRDPVEVPGPDGPVTMQAVWCSVCGATLALLPVADQG